MKVLVNALSVAPGGGFTVARSLVRALADLDSRDVYVVVVKDHVLERTGSWPDNVQFVSAGGVTVNAASRTLWEQVGLRRLLRREGCDVLFGLAGFGLVGIGYPQVVMAQNAYFYADEPWMSKRSRALIFVQRRLQLSSIAAGAYAGCVSEYMRDLVLERMQDQDGRIVVIPHGTDMVAPPLKHTRAVHKRGADTLRLLWLGNAAPHKNLEMLIASLPMVEGLLGQSVQVRIAGKFSDADRTRFESMALSTGLPRSPTFLGYLDRDDLRSEYLRSAVYVSTSRLESFDNGVLEALALGVPVVATDLPVRGSARSVIRTYASGDITGLASVLAEVLGDEDQRAQMSANGIEHASVFTWERSAAQYRLLLARAIDEHHSRWVQTS